MKINISTAKDIQHYMNELQKDERNPDVVCSDKYDEEKLTNFVPVYQIVRWIDNLRKSNDMWRYAVDECFGMLEDAITSDFEPDGSTHNKNSEVSASPTPKESKKAIPSLNPNIRRNSYTPLKSMEQLK